MEISQGIIKFCEHNSFRIMASNLMSYYSINRRNKRTDPVKKEDFGNTRVLTTVITKIYFYLKGYSLLQQLRFFSYSLFIL